MASKAQLKAIAKYDKQNTRSIMLKLNIIHDADILSKLDDIKNKQGYIKALLRDDIKGGEEILSVDSIRYIIQPVAMRYHFERVFLFGSYARGDATAESDVDLLVDGGDIMSMNDYLRIQQDLSDRFGKNVDLVMGEAARGRDSRSGKRFMEHFERDKILLYGQVQ